MRDIREAIAHSTARAEQPAREIAAGSLTAMSGAQTAAIPQRPAVPSLLRDYLTLTKPKVQSLLLLHHGDDDVRGRRPLDRPRLPHLPRRRPLGRRRRRDQPRDRPRHRPHRWRAPPTARWPAAASRPRAAIAFGALLGCASFTLLALTVNPLAAALSLSGLFGYVFVYTLWLKRTTPQNIVIGGAAGAVPPLVAWAAVTGGLSGTAFFLFAIVFFWTPPHFWALSLLMKDEYAKAGDADAAGRPRRGRDPPPDPALHVLLYAVTQLPFCAGGFGVEYLVASMTLGAGFIYCAVRLLRSADRRWALRTYLFSLAYLALLFVSMPLDPALLSE